MEGELAFFSPLRPSRLSFEGRDGCGFGSPTWASQLGTLRDSPSSCVSYGRGGGNGRSGFSSPTWGSPLETLFNAPSSCVSDRHVGGNGSGFNSSTWGSTLETLFNSPSSRVSDSRGVGNGSVFSTPKQASPLETLPKSPSSCVSDCRGSSSGSVFGTAKMALPLETLLNSPSSSISDSRGGGNGSGFSTTKKASPLEPLLNSPSSSVSDSRGCGNSSSPRISKERDSEQVKKAESLLRAITERYDNCVLRLRDTTAELADLRLERVRLGAENLHLSLLLEELDAAEQSKQASAVALTPPPKPTQAEAPSTPKSISIRSKGFLSKKQPQGVATPQRPRVRASQAMEVSPQFLPFSAFNCTPHILLPVHLEGNLHRRAHWFLKLVIVGKNLVFVTIRMVKNLALSLQNHTRMAICCWH